MQEHNVTAHQRKNDPCDIRSKIGSDLPESMLQLSNQRHSLRPSDLDGFNVDAYEFSFFPRQFRQPFSYRLVTGFSSIKNYVQYEM
ncbi:hypothetical protein AO066_01275 [Pseudomonas fluorescens]|nr:hypothetical protein AO066_01275 [Pseudomonas fluorescens]